METYSALPMYAYAWSDPHVDLENPRFVISVEWTWPEGNWTHFSLVRSTRSPVVRREEGQVMMETKGREWDHIAYETRRLPVYRDPQPPPGEWVYYTAFVLNPDRVWVAVGSVSDIGISDYDWALRLPEVLPGVSIGDTTRTISPAQQNNDLVQFLQPPGALLDQVVTMGEAAQYFWDPLRVPPQMLRAMTQSIGYEYDDALGSGRARHVVDALMGPQQGSMEFIQKFCEGVTGCDVRTTISNNLMLDVNDSSFESGDLGGTNWAPSANIEMQKHENYPENPLVLHPNVLFDWFAFLKAAGTYTCGMADPVRRGVPVSLWTQARMGCHARKPSATAVNLSMGLKLYDFRGVHLRDVTILTARPITLDWAWYGTDDAVDLGNPGFAYAVPWITVSNPCSVDLIVVDDG